MKEADLVARIKDRIAEMGGWSVKTHPPPAGTPDLVCCYKGYFFAFEVKTQKGRVSKLQKWTLNQIEKASGIGEVVRSVEEVEELLHARSD